ncbi:MAG: exopolysaccharide biosynthesis polyprenyl glycosylphosphotransferase [Acidobacteriota bacterium]|nr:exopolysaccharide biosynthesis polyprenyl glycosylphosphotransferase [Acidobacteriota bacterium]
MSEPFNGTMSARRKRTSVERLVRFMHGVEYLADAVAVFFAVLLAYYFYRWAHLGRHAAYRPYGVYALAFGAAMLFIMVLRLNGAYSRATSLLRVRETERVLAAAVQLCFFAFAVSFWADVHCPRLVFLFALFFIPLLVLLEKHMMFYATHAIYCDGLATRRTVIYGGTLGGARIFSVLVRSPKFGLVPVAIVDDNPEVIGAEISESGYSSKRSLKVTAGPLTADLLRGCGAEAVVISSPAVSPETFAQISVAAAEVGATLSFVPHDSVLYGGMLSYWEADGLIFASVEEHHRGGLYPMCKRIFDFTASLALLLLLSPLLLLIGAIVRLTSPGPAFFRQERVGRNGRRFSLFKFRTMDETAPKYAFSPKTATDPRITRVGAFLRKTSLDEVPQLINVLRGDMSLVGPRPEMPFIVEQYNSVQRQRLIVEQGITGLWQISADRARLIHENIQYDLYYIQHRNFFMDIAILLHTFFFATRGV